MHRSTRSASRSSCPRFGRRSGGFTVVQILVAVGLLGLVLAAVVGWLRQPAQPVGAAPSPAAASAPAAIPAPAVTAAPATNADQAAMPAAAPTADPAVVPGVGSAGAAPAQDAVPSSPMPGGAR